MDFQRIDPNTYEGVIPSGYDLVIAEEGNIVKTALTLYGWDELDDFVDEFKKPVYGFLRL
jgi:hypothetical protein